MPHLILHLSPELKNENWLDFFEKAHAILSPHANIAQCKSRVTDISSVYLGTHTKAEALIYLEVALKPRPEEVLNVIGDQLFECLNAFSTPILKKYHLLGEPTLELRLLEHYWQ